MPFRLAQARPPGSYVGIGVRIDATEAGETQIVGVFRGSPAEAAGVKVGEIIVSVDGQSTDGRTPRPFQTLVRTVLHNGVPS